MRRGPDWSRLSGTFRAQLSNESMPEDARSSLRDRLHTVKDELCSQDPLPVRVSKMQSATARAEASLVKKEKALFAAKQERDKARSHLDELRSGQQKLTHDLASQCRRQIPTGRRTITWTTMSVAGGRMDPHPGAVPAVCLGIITPRTSVLRVLTAAIRRLLA